MVATMAKVMVGMVTCEIILTNICSRGSVDIWLMCNEHGMGSNTTID